MVLNGPVQCTHKHTQHRVRVFILYSIIYCDPTFMCKKLNEILILNYYSYRNSQQDATVYQNLLFHVYMKLNTSQTTRRPSSGAQNCTSSLWFCIRERMLEAEVAGHCPASSASNNLSRMQNQRLPVQFWAPDDGRRVARNMLSFI